MKKVIVQGRPFALEPCGIKNFSTHFIATLAEQLPQLLFEIIVPGKIDKIYGENQPKNILFTELPQTETKPDYLSALLWENTQTSEYVAKQSKDDLLFYLSPYNCLPFPKLGIPEFVVLHDVDLWIDRGVEWPIERRFGYALKKQSIYNADHIFTVSSFSKTEITSFFKLPEKKVIAIYEDINDFYDKPSDSVSKTLLKFQLEAKNYFLYVGAFEPRKNVELLFRAYHEYMNKNTPAQKKKLVIVGSHNERTKALSENTSLVSEATFISAQSLADIKDLYLGAFAFIYPSKYEGFGLQILEAQATRTALIASNIPTFKEIAGKGALFFDPTEPSGLLNTMTELENNSELRENIIKEGLLNRNKYSWRKTSEIFIKSIKDYVSLA
ncbi:MAG: glycosyltransferase family 1 protein [Patescibacteria group bacterium]|jgi:glycosyltransferase involved in cell wall biosynthesis